MQGNPDDLYTCCSTCIKKPSAPNATNAEEDQLVLLLDIMLEVDTEQLEAHCQLFRNGAAGNSSDVSASRVKRMLLSGLVQSCGQTQRCYTGPTTWAWSGRVSGTIVQLLLCVQHDFTVAMVSYKKAGTSEQDGVAAESRDKPAVSG